MGHISKFFIENQNRFSNPNGNAEQQERFNLYGGLTAMAETIEDLENKIRHLDSQINYLQSRMR